MARMTKAEITERLYRKGLLALLDDWTFRQFLLRMINRAGIYTITHLPGHSDTSAFNEGRRSLGLDLLLDLRDVDPTVYARLLLEEVRTQEETQPPPPEDEGEP